MPFCHVETTTVTDLAAALAAYQRAVQLDGEYALARRELGLLHREQGRAAARAELGRYVALVPDAADRPIIDAYIAELASQ